MNVLGKVLRLRPYSVALDERMTARHYRSLDFAVQNGVSGRVLDVGTGIGWFPHIARGETAMTLSGIEPDATSLAVARETVPDADLRLASALDLPFPDDSFDAITFFEVIEHLPRDTEARAFAEFRRVLKPEGTLVLSTPYADIRAKLTDPAWYVGHRHYSRRRLEALLRSSGFHVEKSCVYGGTCEIASTFFLYFFKWVFRAETPFKEWLENRRSREYSESYAGFTNIFVAAR